MYNNFILKFLFQLPLNFESRTQILLCTLFILFVFDCQTKIYTSIGKLVANHHRTAGTPQSTTISTRQLVDLRNNNAVYYTTFPDRKSAGTRVTTTGKPTKIFIIIINLKIYIIYHYLNWNKYAQFEFPHNHCSSR